MWMDDIILLYFVPYRTNVIIGHRNVAQCFFHHEAQYKLNPQTQIITHLTFQIVLINYI